MNKYLGNQTRQVYNKHKNKNDGTINETQLLKFDSEVSDFFTTAARYLEQWTQPMSEFDPFAWMVLDDLPHWNLVAETVEYLSEKGIILEDSIYEEFMYLKSFIDEKMSDEWKVKNMHDKWLIFSMKQKSKKERQISSKYASIFLQFRDTMLMWNGCFR